MVTLSFPPFVSYTKEEDGSIKRKDCIDFRILDTLAEFYKFTVRTIFLSTILWVTTGGSKRASGRAVGSPDGKWVLDWRGAFIIFCTLFFFVVPSYHNLI